MSWEPLLALAVLGLPLALAWWLTRPPGKPRR